MNIKLTKAQQREYESLKKEDRARIEGERLTGIYDALVNL
jgi:hypothetical protein